MENQPKLNSSKEVIVFLAQRFPLCFCAEGEARPLKIGIFQDLVERMLGEETSLSKTQLRSALRLYTSSWRYLHGVKPGAERVDLDGNACGVLEEQHVEHARQQLVEAKARVQAQRASAQQAKRREAAVEEGDAPRRSRPAKKVRPKSDTDNNKSRQPQQEYKSSKQNMATKKRQQVADVTQLQVGQSIGVNAGKTTMDASVLEITKDGVRVQLANGLAMIVRAEHLRF